MVINNKVARAGKDKMSCRRFRNFDSEKFSDDISSIQILPFEYLTREQVNLVYNKFEKDVTTSVDNHAPMKILYKKKEHLYKQSASSGHL